MTDALHIRKPTPEDWELEDWDPLYPKHDNLDNIKSLDESEYLETDKDRSTKWEQRENYPPPSSLKKLIKG